jgi:carbon monoxide dehydrogenase subunit G
MEIESEFQFEGAREMVWELLHDPDVLAKALPGAERLELAGEDEYVGELRAGVGPVTAARFEVKVRLTDQQPPAAFTMIVDGRGTAGFVEGSARVNLDEAGPDATLMRYRAELQIGGRIAGVGQRLLDSVGRSMARQSLEDLNSHIQSLRGGETDAGALPATSSETSSSLTRPVIISAAVVIVIILLAMLL